MKYAVLCLALGAALALGNNATAQAVSKPPGALSKPEIQKYFAGRRIYGVTPSGNSWLVDFKKNGTFSAVTRKDGDVGKWWVDGDTLCRSWTEWAKRKGKQQACFYIVLDKAKKRVNYYNANGSLYRSWIMSN